MGSRAPFAAPRPRYESVGPARMGRAVTGALSHRMVRGADLDALSRRGNSVYQRIEWTQVVQDGAGYQPVGILTEAPAPVALVIWFETRRGPLRFIGSPLPGCFTPFQRPIWLAAADGRRREIFEGQVRFLRERGYASIEWMLPEPDPEFLAMAGATGARVTEVPTLLMDIDPSVETMWKRMESRGGEHGPQGGEGRRRG